MIIGDPSIFAIESGITQAYAPLSIRALGFFTIHVSNRHYGLYKPDASILACSFDEVERRIARRGTHTAPFATLVDSGKIAGAVNRTLWALNQEDEIFFGLAEPEFHTLVCANKLEWAPDGDQAFDDDSHVLHFDVENQVRLIAFRSQQNDYDAAPGTLSDVWLPAPTFYGILKEWRDSFEAEWLAMPKMEHQF